MKLKEINNIKLSDIYWQMLFGKSKQKATILELRQQNFKNLPAPVFFLSTGRCGTKWFAEFISLDKSIKAFHEPLPNLAFQGKLAYEQYAANQLKFNIDTSELIKEMFLAGREQYLRYSYKTQKRYFETNNQISFFAPVLSELFPNSKFVRIYRHPGEFVRSAMRRKFYEKDNIEDIKRITPQNNNKLYSKWNSYSQIEKNAWLWYETNQFIEKFKNQTDSSRIFDFNFNNLNQKSLKKLIEFLSLNIHDSKIESFSKKRYNVQKKNSYEVFSNWTEDNKNKLWDICGNLATQYGYDIK